MTNENPFERNKEQNYSCFHCDSAGEYGMYKIHEGPTNWYLGLDPDDPTAQAHYACENCVPMLVSPLLVSVQGIEEGDYVRWVGETILVGPQSTPMIKTGEVRQVLALVERGVGPRLALEGRSEGSVFGPVDPARVEKVE